MLGYVSVMKFVQDASRAAASASKDCIHVDSPRRNQDRAIPLPHRRVERRTHAHDELLEIVARLAGVVRDGEDLTR